MKKSKKEPAPNENSKKELAQIEKRKVRKIL